MNVVMVLIDSMNRRFLDTYGCGMGITPNLDRFAKRALTFDNHFISSAPCMPARRELMTGRQEFMWRGWGPLEPFDRPIAAEANGAGAVTAIVTDHYHYWESGAHGYLESFQGSRFIRGHECDYYNTDGFEGEMPDWAQAMADRGRADYARKYYRNVKDFKEEADFFSPKTFSAACDWLDSNHMHEKFFLWVESFDAHEPFHVPEPYKSMYVDGAGGTGVAGGAAGAGGGGMTCWPPYQDGYHGHNDAFWETTTPEEIAYIQAQYKGKLTMVDKWLGKLFDRMDALDLWKNTAVIVTTDHGHELGEKERFGKQPPMYDLSAHIPLMIWHPGYPGGRRTSALTTALDIYPTILEILGAEDVESPHGRSLMPLVSGERAEHRDAVMYATYGSGATITDREYTYHCTWDDTKPLYWYSATYAAPRAGITGGAYIPGVDAPVWRIPWKNERPYPELLFDRRADPGQERNIAADKPEIVAAMRRKLKALMDAQGAPAEQYARLMLTDV